MSVLLGRLVGGFEKLRRLRDIMFSGKYLLLTNVGISVSLSGVGDIIEQSYMIASDQQKDWDRIRTHHMSISGLTIGILCHNWYNFLDHRYPGRSLKIVLKKVLIDQVVFSPISITVLFLTLGLLEKSNADAIGREIISKGKLLYAAEWMVWPPAQIINFYILPTRYRVLYDNLISLGYDIYTSHVKHDLEKKML
ncbi:mpv17-like protein 2 [Rhodnius prolixus]|uniref:Uncharacterized protein n=1 Tax=Rhodnius prolixus TaxID=13249 RepID=T1HAM2_RHOPR